MHQSAPPNGDFVQLVQLVPLFLFLQISSLFPLKLKQQDKVDKVDKVITTDSLRHRCLLDANAPTSHLVEHSHPSYRVSAA